MWVGGGASLPEVRTPGAAPSLCRPGAVAQLWVSPVVITVTDVSASSAVIC